MMRGEFSGVARIFEPISLWGYSLSAFKKLESPRKTEILLATRVLEQRYPDIVYRCHKRAPASHVPACGREIVVVWQRDCCCVAERLLLYCREIVVVWQRDCCCVAERLLCGREIVVEAPSRSPIRNMCHTLPVVSSRLNE